MAVTLFLGGTIRTLDPARPVATALAVRDGVVAAVGGEEVAAAWRAETPTVVDLSGATLLPGFVDPHNHFTLAALEGCWVDCRTPPLTTIAEIQAALRQAARDLPRDRWVRGWGYHHLALAEGRHPTRFELDEAVPDRPVLLLHYSHHQGVASSRALAAAGIGRGTPDPPGGEIDRDRAGEPTGLLYERALGWVERASREAWADRFGEGAAEASRRYAAAGITTVEDAAVDPATEARYRAAEARGQLRIRVRRMQVSPAGWFEPPWALAREPAADAPLKVFVDGGYRCAVRLLRPGGLVARGFLFYAPEALADLLVTAWRRGWRITCHAIGNVGVETCLAAVEAALRREPRGEGRVRLDHALFLPEGLVPRLRALGLPVVTQPVFLHDYGPPGPGLPPDVRPHPFGHLYAAGVVQAFSSDYPCGSLSPLVGIAAAATRRVRTGARADDEPGVPVAAGLEACTLGAARAAGLEADCGSLVPGKRADLVVLDRDPLTVAPEALPGLRVLRTFVEGRQVWP